MEYLGHKSAIVEEVVRAVAGDDRRSRIHVLDAFSGTSVVGASLRASGYSVHANDHLALCAAWAAARLLTPRQPSFAGLRGELHRPSYVSVIDYLNAVPPIQGFITREFSPASLETCSVERRYFTEENARRIDGIRAQIRQWSDRLTAGEQGLLLSTLVDGVMLVSNTAATYGCYLKNWKLKALQPLVLRPVALPTDDDFRGNTVSCDDALHVASHVKADVLYADPPYTKRQYAAYYHVLETIVRDDDPPLVGSTGLRPWREQASDWCHRRRAPGALDEMASKSSAERFVLSYSEDGHIEHDQIIDILGLHGPVSYVELVRRRYRSSQLRHRGPVLLERIYVLDRS